MEIELTNFDCLECGEKSPFAVMRVPFKCKCGFAILDKKLFKGNEYPDSLKKFYDHFNQPERSKREDSVTFLKDLDDTDGYKCAVSLGELEKKSREMRCSEHYGNIVRDK